MNKLATFSAFFKPIKRARFFAFSLLAFAFLAAGCPQKNASEISGSWRVESIASLAAGLLAEPRPTLLIDSEKRSITGFGGCNRFFGNLELGEKNAVRLTGIGSTKMACMGAGGQIEGAFFAALHEADGYVLGDKKLTFLHEKATIAVFSKE